MFVVDYSWTLANLHRPSGLLDRKTFDIILFSNLLMMFIPEARRSH
jgi:hypothetical protein